MLCDTCVHGLVAETDDFRKMVKCTYSSMIVKINVVKCNQYKNNLEKDEYEYAQIAWILETRKGQVIGFMSPSDRKKKGMD